MRAHGLGLVVCTLAGAWISGCASQPAPVDNSLDRLLSDTGDAAPPAPPPTGARPAFDLEARMNEVTIALEEALSATPATAEQQPGDEPAPAAAPADPDSAKEPASGAAAAEGAPDVAESPSIDDIPTKQLAEALAQRMWSEAGQDPFGTAVTLSFLESYFQLGAGADLGASGDRIYRRLTPGQRQTLNAMRHLAHETLRGEASSGETGPAADVLDGLVFTLWDRDPVRIGRVALCEEVRRFGDYDELPSTRFQAGETARMVVYAELDRFRNAPQGAGWRVDLSLEINIFSDAGRTLVWRMPETSYALESSRRIRDVFVPALVELPPTLGAGRYALKVIVRDRSDGSADERIMHVDLVADPRLR
ncbi:MAG: hypothetical protein ACF8Q5_04645 [Phycisphaerales bacterium JB040]